MGPNIPLWCVIFLASCVLVCGGSQRVDTTHGVIQGTTVGDTDAFLGIPFAEPPVGEWRWRSPQPKRPWAPEILQATEKPPGCSQVCDDVSYSCPKDTSEDCLYLSIYRPTNPRHDGLLPVLAYIHGGNFRTGSCSAIVYDGRVLAPTMDVIFVCIDYRLGAHGFLYIDEDPETGERVAGNFGLEDQVAGLRYLQDNIENFGGDPRRITVAGQSAGGESIVNLLLDEQNADLFAQVMIFSPPLAAPLKTPVDSNTLGQHFASLAHCPHGNMTCLREKPSDLIAELTHDSMAFSANGKKMFQLLQQWGPTVDVQMVEGFEMGMNLRKPAIVGSVSEEGRIFVRELLKDPIPGLVYRLVLPMLIDQGTDELLRIFPADRSTRDQRDVMSDIVTQYMFSCPIKQMANTLVVQGESNVYNYVFNHSISFDEAWERFTWCRGHVCHGSDVPFISPSIRSGLIEGISFNEVETAFSDKYSTYLRNFIHNGDPNVGFGDDDVELPKWPKFGGVPDRMSTIILQPAGIESMVTEESEACQFFGRIGYSDVPNINKKGIDPTEY